MLSCRFVYRFPTGDTSDSLNEVHDVHVVPAVGDTVCFVGGDGGRAESEVKEVVHYINRTDKTHDVVVYYGHRHSASPTPSERGHTTKPRK